MSKTPVEKSTCIDAQSNIKSLQYWTAEFIFRKLPQNEEKEILLQLPIPAAFNPFFCCKLYNSERTTHTNNYPTRYYITFLQKTV